MTDVARYAGVDWASREHALCVVDGEGRAVAERPISHTEKGVLELIAAIRKLGVREVAIELSAGLLVDRLVDAGLPVLSIEPRVAAASRNRYAASDRKSDAFDAFCLAELARTDGHRFSRLEPDSDQTRTLRALTRAREDLIHHKVSITRQLRDQLNLFWPGAASIFADLDSPISLAFLRAFPSPADARGLDEERLAELLRENSSRVRDAPREFLERLHRAPTGTVGPVENEARRMAVLSLVALLHSVTTEVKAITKEIVTATHDHPDGELFLPLFRVRKVVTPALLIAGFGDDRRRFPKAEFLAVRAGVVPMPGRTARQGSAVFRSFCDWRLRGAVVTLANGTRKHHPWARSVYEAARDRGHKHPQALRVLGRAWLRVLWRCWQDRVPYDPDRHGGLRQLEARQGPGR